MPRPLTSTEAELLRLLDHALKCDGIDCPTCEAAYQRLLDGNVHALENPLERIDQVDRGMQELGRRLELIYGRLEGMPVPASLRSALIDCVNGVVKIRGVMRLPLTTNRPTLVAPIPPRVKPPRTPVVMHRLVAVVAMAGR